MEQLDETLPRQRDAEREDTDRVDLRQTFVIYRDSSSNSPPPSPPTTASGHLEPRIHTLRSHVRQRGPRYNHRNQASGAQAKPEFLVWNLCGAQPTVS